MFKMEINYLQWLICHKIKPNQTKPNQSFLKSHYQMQFSVIISFFFEEVILAVGVSYSSAIVSLF